jgi:hypothetical protein
MRIAQDNLDSKNFYAFNPSYKADMRLWGSGKFDCKGE